MPKRNPPATDATDISAPAGADPADTPAVEGEEGEGVGGAFNPVTGEINWDCPCLGGMAHGPCGPQFREAFSCFVYSEEEPKGIDCVEKFKGMQDCFRAHPEVYAEGAYPARALLNYLANPRDVCSQKSWMTTMRKRECLLRPL